MATFHKLFGGLLLFVYHCFDRIVVQGYLPLLTRPEHLVHFFRDVHGVYPSRPHGSPHRNPPDGGWNDVEPANAREVEERRRMRNDYAPDVRPRSSLASVARSEIIAQIARLVVDDGQAVIPGDIEQTLRGDVEGGGSGPPSHFLVPHRVEDEEPRVLLVAIKHSWGS